MTTEDHEDGDIQAAKRDLLRLAREQGHIHEREIEAMIPLHHLTTSEIEILFFTIEMMEVPIYRHDGTLRRNAARLDLSLHHRPNNPHDET
jgi:hypothetical protein